MEKHKKILGKGLSALISQINSDDTTSLPFTYSHNIQKIIDINISAVIPNPNQPRKVFNSKEISELSASIKEHGVIQPILVKKIHEGKYELVAGERRLQASKQAGLSKIPAIIKELDEITSFEYAIIENIQRQNLNILEEALAYQKLISYYHYTHEQLAKKLGKSRSHISNCLRILTLPAEIHTLIEEDKLSFGHARALLAADHPIELANKIINHNLSVRDAEKIVKSLKPIDKQNISVDNDNSPDAISDIPMLEQMLSVSLKAKIKITHNNHNQGIIQINFESLAQLDNIIQILGSKVLNF